MPFRVHLDDNSGTFAEILDDIISFRLEPKGIDKGKSGAVSIKYGLAILAMPFARVPRTQCGVATRRPPVTI